MAVKAFHDASRLHFLGTWKERADAWAAEATADAPAALARDGSESPDGQRLRDVLAASAPRAALESCGVLQSRWAAEAVGLTPTLSRCRSSTHLQIPSGP